MNKFQYQGFDAYINLDHEVISYQQKDGSRGFRNFNYPGIPLAKQILDDMGLEKSWENIQTLLAPTQVEGY